METNFIQDYLNSIPNTTLARTSIQNIQKTLSSESLIPRKSTYFIPFLQERDGMNKLISPNSEHKAKADFALLPDNSLINSPKLRLKKKVKSKQINPIYPSVGSYNVQSNWIKKTFSNKASNFPKLTESTAMQTKTSATDSNNRLPHKEEYKAKINTDKKRKINDNRIEEVIERKDFRNLAQRPLGTWNSLRIHGTPEEIKEELKFSQEKAAIKKYQSEIKSELNKLKR